MSKELFGEIVQEAVASLPEPFRQAIETTRLEVRDRPAEVMRRHTAVRDGERLLGLYVGHPQIDRSVEDPPCMPDTIYLFQREIEEICASRRELIEQVRITVLHEVGHYFGLNEGNLDELGYG